MNNTPDLTENSAHHVRCIVAQLGARRHYLVPEALNRLNVLSALYTDLYFGRFFLDNIVRTILPRKYAQSFAARHNPSVSSSLVTDYRSLLLASRSRHPSETKRWLATGTRFCQNVAKQLHHSDANVVYAFSSAALEIFEAATAIGLKTVLDHATAPRDHELALVAEEEEAFPGWVASKSLADPYLKAYCERQQRERELADTVLVGSGFVKSMLHEADVDAANLHIESLPLAFIRKGHDEQSREVKQPRGRGGSLNVLFVGSEGLRKGIGYLVKAVRLLDSSVVTLRVAGNLGLSSEGMREVQKVSDFVGPVPRSKMAEFYDWADVLVLPTISDTFGLVILEAMAYGVPVLTTQNSAGPEIVRDGLDGWIIPIRSVDAIAEKLQLLIDDPSLAVEMGRNAQSRALQFSFESYSQRLLQILQKSIFQLK